MKKYDVCLKFVDTVDSECKSGNVELVDNGIYHYGTLIALKYKLPSGKFIIVLDKDMIGRSVSTTALCTDIIRATSNDPNLKLIKLNFTYDSKKSKDVINDIYNEYIEIIHKISRMRNLDKKQVHINEFKQFIKQDIHYVFLLHNKLFKQRKVQKRVITKLVSKLTLEAMKYKII
jgi:hypothetical protein